jgi:hypothetical protein
MKCIDTLFENVKEERFCAICRVLEKRLDRPKILDVNTKS